MQWTITSTVDLVRILGAIRLREDFPFRIIVLKGKEERTKAQNRMIHKWFGEIAKQKGDEDMMEIKMDCNIAYGEPILMRDDPEWAAVFGYLFSRLNIEKKRKAIRALGVPFTSRMHKDQLSEYMARMSRDYRQQGFELTDPELMKYQ